MPESTCTILYFQKFKPLFSEIVKNLVTPIRNYKHKIKIAILYYIVLYSGTVFCIIV